MTYGMSVWGTLSLKSLQTSLYKLQQECMSAMCKPLETVKSAFNRLKIIRLPDLITFHQPSISLTLANTHSGVIQQKRRKENSLL